MSNCCPVCPRKRTSLPILERLPPPALRECRHRGLARRFVPVSGATDGVAVVAVRPHAPHRCLLPQRNARDENPLPGVNNASLLKLRYDRLTYSGWELRRPNDDALHKLRNLDPV